MSIRLKSSNRLSSPVHWIGIITAFFLTFYPNMSSSVLADSQNSTSTPTMVVTSKSNYPKLDSYLSKLVSLVNQQSQFTVEDHGVISVGKLVAVTTRIKEEQSQLITYLKSIGAIISNVGTDYIESYTPVKSLISLSSQKNVLKVSAIIEPKTEIVSQGTSIHRSSLWNNYGYSGSSVKVGIIDAGFMGYSALMGSELPTQVIRRCYVWVGIYSSNLPDCETDTVHGTAVAEALTDIAPQVQLYIANPFSKGDLKETAEWMTSQGVEIINMSMSWTWDGPGNGTSLHNNSPLNTVDQAIANGAVWVNSAGNQAEDSWYGSYSDFDSDKWIEFQSGSDYQSIAVNAGDKINIQLRWDDQWGQATSDLDLYLYSPSLTVVDRSTDSQQGYSGEDPYEFLSYTAPTAGSYRVKVKHYSGPVLDWVQLNVFSNHNLSIPVSDRSVSSPSESANPGLLSVGATAWNTPTIIETFSGRGPTIDGRIKPDIVGADRGDSISYGAFAGTSQASPHVAGLAALVKERWSVLPPIQIAEYLKNNALPSGSSSPNNDWGYGLAYLPGFPPGVPTSVSASEDMGQARVSWSEPSSDGGSPITLYTVKSNPGNITATTTSTYVVVAGLTHGVTYTFSVTAANGVGESDPSESSNTITLVTVPSSPTGLLAVAGNAKASVSWTAPSDDGGTPITAYTVTSLPGNITSTTTDHSISITGLNNGVSYTFTVTASNSVGESDPSIASNSITPSSIPIAISQSVSMIEDDTLSIFLEGQDPDGNNLTFLISSHPSDGTLSSMTLTGTSTSSILYVPAENFNGSTSFTFTVNNGFETSTAATVDIQIIAVNDPPSGQKSSISTDEDTSIVVTLNGSDPEGDILNFLISEYPIHGTLGAITFISLQSVSIEYLPEENYYGVDSFKFQVHDGEQYSTSATISVNISPVNDKPVSISQDLLTSEEITITINLSATDEEEDELVFGVVSPPVHGVLSSIQSTGTSTARLSYTPETDFYGADSFIFIASDGLTAGQPSTIFLEISNVNDLPVMSNSEAEGTEGTPVSISVPFTDPDQQDVDTHTATVFWGDGTSDLAIIIRDGISGTINSTHNYNSRGVYEAKIALTELAGNEVLKTVIVTVENGIPVVDAGYGSDIYSGSHNVIQAATFSDPGLSTDHAATIDWGDGFSSNASIDHTTKTITANHIYRDSGSYDVVIKVTDNDGATGSDSITIDVISTPSFVAIPSINLLGLIVLSFAMYALNTHIHRLHSKFDSS